MLALAIAPAWAATGSGATSTGYGGQSGVQDTLQGASQAPQTAPQAAGSLPFTGLDLGVIIAAGVALIVMGASLRRVSRQ